MNNPLFDEYMKIADNGSNGVSERMIYATKASALQLQRIADALEKLLEAPVLGLPQEEES